MTPTPEQIATALAAHHADWRPPAWWVCPDHPAPFIARQRRGTRGATCPACGQTCAHIRGVTP